MTPDYLGFTIFAVSIVLVFGVGIAVGTVWEKNWWRGQMVERGHARYNWRDGAWRWNEDDIKANQAIRAKTNAVEPARDSSAS